MVYKIKDCSYQQAEKLGVEIKPSTNPKKKIDVYKNGKTKLLVLVRWVTTTTQHILKWVINK